MEIEFITIECNHRWVEITDGEMAFQQGAVFENLQSHWYCPLCGKWDEPDP